MYAKLKKTLKWVVPAAICIVIGCAVVVFYQKDQSAGQTTNGTQESEKSDDSGSVDSTESTETEQIVVLGDTVYRYTDDIESMLILGTDQSGSEDSGTADDEEESYHGAMADMLMVVVINHTREEYAILQLNRDTITNVHIIDENGEGYASADIQLCTAHWYGGNEEQHNENTVRSVCELLGGVPVNTYYCLTWEGIKTLNTVVDGVTVTIQNDFSEVDPTMVLGETITLTDDQAYTFLRNRYDVDDGENIGRMERHRQYLTAWMQKVKELTAEDGTFPAKIYQSLAPYADTNLKGSQITKSTARISGYTNLGILTLDGTTAIGSDLGDGIDHMEFYVDDDALTETLQSLYHLEETDYDPEDFDLDEYEDWGDIAAEYDDTGIEEDTAEDDE
jgi:LCP family protein required for cell wall assembly